MGAAKRPSHVVAQAGYKAAMGAGAALRGACKRPMGARVIVRTIAALVTAAAHTCRTRRRAPSTQTHAGDAGTDMAMWRVGPDADEAPMVVVTAGPAQGAYSADDEVIRFFGGDTIAAQPPESQGPPKQIVEHIYKLLLTNVSGMHVQRVMPGGRRVEDGWEEGWNLTTDTTPRLDATLQMLVAQRADIAVLTETRQNAQEIAAVRAHFARFGYDYVAAAGLDADGRGGVGAGVAVAWRHAQFQRKQARVTVKGRAMRVVLKPRAGGDDVILNAAYMPDRSKPREQIREAWRDLQRAVGHGADALAASAGRSERGGCAW